MRCPRCQHENEAGAKFCEECATPLARTCSNCGRQLSATAKFCPECAHPASAATPAPRAQRFISPESYTPKHLAEKILTSKSALEGERKQVTVLFADLKGSMELLADRDPEEARKLLDPALELMMEAVHRYEGTVNQVMGDGIMALFGAPLALEDHAVRACYAALRMHEAVKRHAEKVRRDQGVAMRIRIGVNSGEVVVRAIGSDLHMDYTAVGQTTHLAARMEQLADPGTTLMTADTRGLAGSFVETTPLGPMAVKGMSGPIEVFELSGAGSVRSRLQAGAARGLSPFVGRDTEIGQLLRAIEHAQQGRGQVAAIMGEPGVGKSRLTFELTHSPRLEGWRVLEASTSSHGKTTSYLPVMELLRGCLGIGDREGDAEMRAKISGRLSEIGENPWPAVPAFETLLGVPVGSPRWSELEPRQRRQHTLEALTRLILRESRRQPVLLILEDLHWIDTESQAWLDSLVDGLPAARLLLLVTYRPEYQHSWGNRTYYVQLRVDPLPRAGAEDLLLALLGPDPALASLRALLIDRTDGNPFFLEETVRALVESKALVTAPEGYRLAQPLDSVRVPATVQAILASRIDRLPPAEKQLLQSAAVIGREVPLGLLSALAGGLEDVVRRQLAVLQGAEFLYETRLFPESEYTFKHALTQEVAYGGLLTERRRTVHARIVDEIERLHGDRLGEQVEQLAHHALRAERWSEALRYGRQAGTKAIARWALREAAAHLEHALAAARHLPETREVIAEMIDARLDLRNAIHTLGEVERGQELMREAASLAERLGDEARTGKVAQALSVSLWMLGRSDEAEIPNARARAIAESTGDVPLGHQARIQRARIDHDRGEYRRAAVGLRDALSALDATGDRFAALSTNVPLVVAGTSYLGWTLAELGEFEEAARWTEAALRATVALDNPFGSMMAYMGVGMVHVRHGDAAAAISPLEQGLRICYEFGLTALAFHGIAASAGVAYMLANRVAEAIPLLQKVADQAGAMKLVSDHLLGAIPLAEVWLVTGRLDDAERLCRQSLDLARAHKQRGHEVYALRLLGAVTASRDASAEREAAGHFRSALALAEPRGMRPLVAHCHLGLGKLYQRTGKREQAQEHLTTATTMYREMGMTYWLEQAETEMVAIG
jgi:class 3 adenylate cyclase/tetratricopeptide (TPR) repeat protein